jgi:hypothetical protein
MAAVRQRQHVRLIKSAAQAAAVTATLFFILFNLPLLLGGESEIRIFANPGKYGPYYHLQLRLKAASIDFDLSDITPSSGGQFEIRLRPEFFPLPAPNCRGPIILRMPWTASESVNAKNKIAAKEALLKRILALRQLSEETLSVVVELNPYVEVIGRDPLRLQLTACNVFFRHAFGAYVDHAQSLKPG